MSKILIENGTIVDGGRSYRGWVMVGGERIAAVGEGVPPAEFADGFAGTRIDATGRLVMPGVIDDHVHFREPGLEYKATIASESRAAVAGGVTSFMDMPNTLPPAVTRTGLERKEEIAAVSSMANHAFYLGATGDNIEEIRALDPRRTCGVKVFMGSSTGGMLLDDEKVLSAVFAESPVPVAAHCEDEAIVRGNAAAFKARYGDDVAPAMHAEIRSAEACYRSSARAVALADRYGAHLHVLHLTTARELALFDAKPLTDKKITAEACVHHLWFSDGDYAAKGNLIKVNPSIKTPADRQALREALTTGKIDIVGTDHAPHTLDEKRMPYWNCPSGAPAIQHSLPAMLAMVGPELAVEKMCHAPAVRFGVVDRGFLRAGMYADIVIVAPREQTVERAGLFYKCGWSPYEGARLSHTVERTIINGRLVYDRGTFDEGFRGMALKFWR